MAKEIKKTKNKRWVPMEGRLVRHVLYDNIAIIVRTGSFSAEYKWLLVSLDNTTSDLMFNDDDEGFEKIVKAWYPLKKGERVTLEQV